MLKWIMLVALLAIDNSGKEKNSPRLAQQNSEYHRPAVLFFENNETGYPYTQSPSADSPHWYARPEWWLCIFGVPTLIFLGCQVSIMRGTLAEIKAQAGHMERQNRNAMNSERARLVVSIAEEKLPITDFGWRITFLIDNIGRSHAFKVWVRARFEFTPSYTPPLIPQLNGVVLIPRIKTEKRRRAITYPSAGNSGGEFTAWDEQTRIDVAAGKMPLHLRGTVEYEDIFGEPHVTPFRYMWHPAVEPPQWFEAVNSEDPKST